MPEKTSAVDQPPQRYWMMGNCLAGDTCVFSHDPSLLMGQLALDDVNGMAGHPLPVNHQPDLRIQDDRSFPALQQLTSNRRTAAYGDGQIDGDTDAGVDRTTGRLLATSPSAFNPSSFTRSRSRPTSHHSRAATPSIPSVDDPDAFPSLASSGAKASKKAHGTRTSGGHASSTSREQDGGHGTPNTLAGILRMAPSPSPSPNRATAKVGGGGSRSSTGLRENNSAAQAIPAPKHIPWLETGEKANTAYLKARQEALRHGGLRNKFLQRWVVPFLVSLPPKFDISYKHPHPR